MIPEDLIDWEGYPTHEWLAFIEAYTPSEVLPLPRFIKALRDSWYYPDRGFILKRKRKGKQRLELHTGGWSGNEDIIRSLLGNSALSYVLGYRMWKRGGHYYFELTVQ